MTRFITLRTQRIAGSIAEPSVVETPPLGQPLAYTPPLDERRVAADAAGRNVVLAVHGFNVSRDKGARSLAALEAALQLDQGDAFFGVLWPGDWWVPAINYPTEARDAVKCGEKLAAFIDRNFALASSISLVSHSLGGRVLLETVTRMSRKAREVCVTAGAVDDNCLQAQYARAAAHAERTTILASRRDMVLKLAYPLGDFASDVVFRDKDSPWRAALGLKGPRPPAGPPVHHQQIPDSGGYGHGDYFPPGDGGAGRPEWRVAAEFMRRTLRGEVPRWP